MANTLAKTQTAIEEYPKLSVVNGGGEKNLHYMISEMTNLFIVLIRVITVLKNIVTGSVQEWLK